MPPELRVGYLTDPDRIARLVDAMLLAEQVAMEAEKAGLQKDAEYRADTALLGTELLSGRFVRNYVAGVKTPNFDNLAQERYLANSKQFTPPPIRPFGVSSSVVQAVPLCVGDKPGRSPTRLPTVVAVAAATSTLARGLHMSDP